MQVEIRGDSVVLSGYVNSVERFSKPITSPLRNKLQTFIERVKAGTFKNALKRNDDVKVLLNHGREVANTKDGSAKLEEDNIGLRAEVVTSDKEVVEKARNNRLSGWSFGFYSNADDIGTEDGMTTRTLTDLDLVEVSILDDTRKPAYYGTSIESRSEDGKTMEIRGENMNEETQKEQGLPIEQLAELVANRVAELLKPKEEEPEEEPADETPTEEPEEDKKAEGRAIDYSAFEERLHGLN